SGHPAAVLRLVDRSRVLRQVPASIERGRIVTGGENGVRCHERQCLLRRFSPWQNARCRMPDRYLSVRLRIVRAESGLNSFLFTPARRSSAAQLLVRAHATAVELIGDNAWAGLEFCQCAGAIEAWNLRGSPGLLISGLAGVAGGAEAQGVTEQ